MKTVNVRLDAEGEAAVEALSRLHPDLSQNQILNRILRDFAAIADGANEQRSWRRGEASGFRQLADWCRMRADHFARDPSATAAGKGAIDELRWCARQFAHMAREASAGAENLRVGLMRAGE